MESKAVSGIMLALLLIGMLALAYDVQSVKAESTTWTVDDDGPADFSSIQEAVNSPDVKDGDTLYVRNGTYYENVVVSKSVSLVGENRSATIIDGGLRTGFRVTSDYVDISGFTIRNCGPPEGGPYAGIHLDSSDNCKISGNIMNNNYWGIWPDSSSNNTIFNNTFSNCAYAVGGTEMSGNNQKIFNNFISDSYFGIYLKTTANSHVSNNTILNSVGLGIYLQFCSNIILTNNNMTGHSTLQVLGTSLTHFIHDIDVSNTMDGKPVYYLINQRNLVIDPLAFPDIGYLGLVNSTNIVVRNLNLTRTGQGLLLAYTTHSTVTHLNVSFNSEGIDMFGSNNNTITDNNVISNGGGIELNYVCNNNTISNNTISNNEKAAILGILSDSNIIKYNTLSKNGYGVVMFFSTDNTIHHNNFINNTEQVLNEESISTWDDGYPSGGNYWSDYTGIDAKSGPNQDQPGNDGIGDTPYVIDENNQDNYPLVEPWSPKPPSPQEALEELTQTVESWNLGNGIENSLTSKLQAAHRSLDRENQKASLGQLKAFINQVKALRDKKLTDEQADQLIAEAQRIIDLIRGQTT